jgi:Uma2 family endonuclease
MRSAPPALTPPPNSVARDLQAKSEDVVSVLVEKRMTLDEFLRWDDGTDTRYELIDGFSVAMAPPAEAHRILAVRLVSRIDAALQSRRPCNAQVEPGVVRPDRADSYYVPDLAVTCRANEPGRQVMVEPILIVEILSPSTERYDRRVKLPVYRQIESVQEILLIDADGHYAELHRRDDGRWLVELIRGGDATLSLMSVELRLSMAELYDGIAMPAAAAR